MNDYPVSLIVVGLPRISGLIFGVGDDDETSGPMVLFPPHLSPLSDDDSRRALATPIKDSGGYIERAELDNMVAFAEGHPLTLRMLGGAAWEVADQDTSVALPLVIEAKHVALAVDAMRRQLRLAYYEPMWRRSTHGQREVMISLASALAQGKLDISGVMGSVPNADDLLYELFSRGVVYEARSLEPRFAIPGFGQYVQLKAAN